jgi:hypothetical protein
MQFMQARKSKTPSMPIMEAAAAQAVEEVSCWHIASGAMMRSTCCGLDGCAAGHKSKPSVVGIARAPAQAQESEKAFLQGKTIRMVVGSGTGGGYDVYARLISPYLS